jgi:hypothetical protein
LHLDVTTPQSSGAQEGTSTKIPQAGLDDTGIDRSRDGGLECLVAKKGYEESQQDHAREGLHACEDHTMDACPQRGCEGVVLDFDLPASQSRRLAGTGETNTLQAI